MNRSARYNFNLSLLREVLSIKTNLMKRIISTSLTVIILLCITALASAQTKKQILNGKERLEGFSKLTELRKASSYKDLKWQYVGPVNISGRCTDVESISRKDGSFTIWIATASGGVWKSINEANTFEPVFEDMPTAAIGDLAIDPNNPDVVWVGTGEANIFRSSNSGLGIFKTIDGGKSWQHMGLENTNTIARIRVNPKNSDIVYVACGGNEWTDNEERGLYKTSDGGLTWEKILYVNDRTAANDIILDPSNPEILYCSTWERIRDKWNDPRTYPNTKHSGIWKSVDGGKKWKKINKGLVDPQYRGRIGIDIAASNPNVLYAYVDNYEFAKVLEEGVKDTYGRDKKGIIKGATIYRTNDGGENWMQVSGLAERQKTYMESHSSTYGWVFSQIRVDPQNEDRIYTMGLFLNVSDDGGKTFRPLHGMHVDHHGLWIDPNNSNYLLNVQDGGLAISYDKGENWKTPIAKLPLAQFFTLEYDMQKPFNVYGSIQDHGSYHGQIDLSRGVKALKPVEFPAVLGGEGTNHVIDPRDNTVFASSFYGAIERIKPGEERSKVLLPQPIPGEVPLRGQWLAPTELSPHNPDILYHGMQYLMMSKDRGDTWEKISPDLTGNNPKHMGDISYQTLTALSESPLRFGLIYVGTDDGNIWRTMDGGKNWDNICKDNLPVKWVTRMVASQYDVGTVYLSQTGRRDDDFQAYLWKSSDFGNTWKDISGDIPLGGINVIREDPGDSNILYVGADAGVYVSKNRGESWEVLGNLPFVYVHDLQVHPRDNVIIIGTHGRGVWVLEAGYVNNPAEFSQVGGSGISASAAQIENLLGKWILMSEMAGNKMEMLMEFKKEGELLSGKLSFQFGEADLSTLSYDGTNLSFSAIFEVMGESLGMKGAGTIKGNIIEGSLSNDMTGKANFTGKKE